jgi:hypothetical protein
MSCKEIQAADDERTGDERRSSAGLNFCPEGELGQITLAKTDWDFTAQPEG